MRSGADWSTATEGLDICRPRGSVDRGRRRHHGVGRAPVGGDEPVLDRPLLPHRHERVAVAPVVIKADLGENREVAA